MRVARLRPVDVAADDCAVWLGGGVRLGSTHTDPG